jgi:nitrate/nitrite transporter NarK
MVVNGFGYSSVHAFYPNMSKFFQVRFQFSNTQAGTISSLPYLIASFTVPIIGTLINRLGELYFELLIFVSLVMILTTHFIYLVLADVTLSGMEGSTYTWMPLLLFGLGHALFTTM